jgi:signal transduction histidine kinase
MEPLSASHNIALACDTADVAHIDADPEMLERAIVALIDNALRFARSAVAVAVSVDGMHASIAVSDDGPGFSDRGLHEATRRFWREDPARSGEGTGLGLAIARSIVERHNGTIALHNVAGGGGAVVVLLIPLASAAVT